MTKRQKGEANARAEFERQKAEILNSENSRVATKLRTGEKVATRLFRGKNALIKNAKVTDKRNWELTAAQERAFVAQEFAFRSR
jgi:hypothetical protein